MNCLKLVLTALTDFFIFLDDTEPVSLNGETEDEDEDTQKEKDSKQESLKISNGKLKHFVVCGHSRQLMRMCAY